jgi:hypothetical protein
MDQTTSSEAPHRWWRDPRWIILVLVASTAGLILWGLFGSEPTLIVSRETTLITEPLRPDGTPDYAAHVLDLLGRDTPPEENAAVAILHATWPMNLEADDLAAVCKALGIPNTPPDVPPTTSAESDTALRDELQKFVEQLTSDDGSDLVLRLIKDARSIPWMRNECPPLAAWLDRQSPALDLVIEGANRPLYSLPWPDLLRADDGSTLMGMSMVDVDPLREVCRNLLMRAMLHLGEGRTAEAWRDIHAVHRLARLIAPAGRPRFLIPHLVSIAIASSATSTTVALVESPHLSAELAATIRRDLESLPPPADAASSLELERLGVLDAVFYLERIRLRKRPAGPTGMASDLRPAMGVSFDVNAVLRAMNAAFDRIEGDFSIPVSFERRQALSATYADFSKPPVGPSLWQRAEWLAKLAMSRSARSAAWAHRLQSLLLPAGQIVLDAFERHHATVAIVKLAAALAEYRARGLGGDGKPYPEKLDELVPAVLGAVPDDPCSGEPFRYERRGDGCLLYSFGTNGVDDGGTNGELDRGEWRTVVAYDHDVMFNDVVIRLPRPKRPLLPPANATGQ